MAIRASRLVAAAAICPLAAAGCATLPDTDALIARHNEQAVRFENASGPLSAKKSAAAIDGVRSTVGSTNLDWRSFLDNDEIKAVVLGRDFALQMRTMFDRDLEASEAIDLETWERRSPILRLKEWGATLLQRLL